MLLSPLVTVIIPCYNYGRFLAAALDSILNQTYEAWECLIVDDGSEDETKEVALRYTHRDARFRYLFQKNSGVSAARNTALKQAEGAYIQLLDADDLLEKEKLRLQVALLQEKSDVDLVYSHIRFFKDGDTNPASEPKLLQGKKAVSGSGATLLQALVEDNLFLPGCVLFRRALWKVVGDFKRGIEGIEDWDFFYRAALAHQSFHHDAREGTRLLARNHGRNASADSFTMLTHKIKARAALLVQTQQLGATPASGFSKHFMAQVCQAHKALLSRDKARLHFYYSSLLQGGLHVIKHAYYSGRVYFAVFDGAYWLKERIKKRLEKR